MHIWPTIIFQAESAARDAITRNAAVTATTNQGERRIVIDGYGEDPCGGTHVRRLGQLTGFAIRSIKVKAGVLKVGYDVSHIDEPL
jgi:alanyl-tRNA synthetase